MKQTTGRHKVFDMAFAKVYPAYVAKAAKKGRTKAELDEVIRWQTGYTQKQLEKQIEKAVTLEAFFAEAPKPNPARELITGVICGVRVEEIEDPPDARDPLPGQTRGRAREGQGDGEDFAGVGG